METIGNSNPFLRLALVWSIAGLFCLFCTQGFAEESPTDSSTIAPPSAQPAPAKKGKKSKKVKTDEAPSSNDPWSKYESDKPKKEQAPPAEPSK